MLTERKIRIEVKSSENRCGKCLRLIVGGIVGAAAGFLKPAAEWLLNIRDRIQEKNASEKVRWPAILDIGASAVVAYGSVVRFGQPALWVIVAVEAGLTLWGFVKGLLISQKKHLLEIPKQLWNWSVSNKHAMGDNLIVISQAESTKINFVLKPVNKIQKICHAVSGAFLGFFAALTMPLKQLLTVIYSAKRRWPPLINGGVLTSYALYVGSIYIGGEYSILIAKRLAQVLGVYGMLRGGYLGYTQEPSKVLTMMWSGGFNTDNNADKNTDNKANNKAEKYGDTREKNEMINIKHKRSYSV